jgi:hypothetical protein
VACILQHVPLRQRLNCCALVCRSWAAAAAAAPAEVNAELDSERCEQLQDWLAKHGGVVVGLTTRLSTASLRWRVKDLLALPVQKLTQLRRLELYQLKVYSSAAGSTSSAAGSTSSAAVTLPRLQELRLHCCELTVQLLSQLLSTTALTKLHLACVPKLYSSNTWIEQLEQGPAFSILWQRLQLLPQLSELTLEVASASSLTAADIAPLSSLQHLQRFDFITRSKLPTLQWFVEDEISVHRELLAALQHLTHLRHLQLHGSAAAQQGDSYQCFSALTASTQLTAMELLNTHGMPFPQTAFNHIFPPARVLPHLKVLHLHGCQPCVEAAQILRVAASCPALQQLELVGVTPDDFDDSCLLQLPIGVMEVTYPDKDHCWFRPAAVP